MKAKKVAFKKALSDTDIQGAYVLCKKGKYSTGFCSARLVKLLPCLVGKQLAAVLNPGEQVIVCSLTEADAKLMEMNGQANPAASAKETTP